MKRLIKIMLLAAAVAFAWSVQPNVVAAEKVKTTRKVRLMSRPGEKSRVVKRVPSGKTMKVLKRKGRWIKVRVGSQSGWVTRTSVRAAGDARQARKSVRKTRRKAFVEGRSKRRGWTDSAPEDRIGADSVDDDDDDDADRPRRKSKKKAKKAKKKKKKSKKKKSRRASDDEEDFDDEEEDFDDEEEDFDDEEEDFDDEEEDEDDEDDEDEDEAEEEAVPMVTVRADEAEVFAKPSSRSGSQFVAEAGDKLFFVSRSKSGKWIEVENDDGKSGWVKAKYVEMDNPFGYKKLNYAASGGLGYTALGMTFTSDGAGNLSNYQMSSAAASLVVGGDIIYAGGSKTRLIAGDLQYRGTRATPGIRYNDGTNVADIGFTMHEIDAGASYGYRFKRKDGLAVFARGGFHYSQFQIHNVEDTAMANLARLPSELLRGFTLGGRVAAPRLTKTIGVSLEAEYLLGGSRAQTVGLEDGTLSSVMAAWAILQVRYQWKPSLEIVGVYRYYLSNTDWTGNANSMRGHNAAAAERKDVIHTLSVGVGKSF